MSSVQRLFSKLGGKKKAHPSAPLPEALPYPAQVRRRFYLDCARDAHNLRGIFVAIAQGIRQPKLVSLLTD